MVDSFTRSFPFVWMNMGFSPAPTGKVVDVLTLCLVTFSKRVETEPVSSKRVKYVRIEVKFTTMSGLVASVVISHHLSLT